MADSCHFDKLNCYISATVLPVVEKLCMMIHVDPINPIGG